MEVPAPPPQRKPNPGKGSVPDPQRCPACTDCRQLCLIKPWKASSTERYCSDCFWSSNDRIVWIVKNTDEVVLLACDESRGSLECLAMAKRIADSSAEARRLATLFEISQALS